ncbi:MAG TPA: hypothetical protein VE954_12620 [Oligoflexus sp.]|uniref:hypothetical protein n=1 Tax=Oligoflexus sp. TaxID=1971216 RepID=UPI002D5A0F08|nr:hypothetical protein [Oligoflexus sp.]HYX33951.1 hypothetical protein [Oligoflexus sp.]
MKRIPVLISVLIVSLAGGGAWMGWQHKKEKDLAQAAEVKRVVEEAKAKVEAEAAQKAADEASPSGRSTDPPLDLPDGPHFAFAHHVDDRVGFEHASEGRPPLYTHLVCSDGTIQALTFDYSWLQPGSTSYDFYKVPVATKGYDRVCLSLRKEEVTTYRTIVATRKPGCDATAEGSSCDMPLPAKECSDADKEAIRSLAGRDKDTVRWCEIASAGERFGFLQAVTQRGKSCEINSWLLDGGKLRPMGDPYTGEFKVEEGQRGPPICVFPLADGDIPEKDMTDHGGPTSPELIFELGQKTYIVERSSGSEGFTSTIYRLHSDRMEKIVDYYKYDIDHNFWTSTGEPQPTASDSEAVSP